MKSQQVNSLKVRANGGSFYEMDIPLNAKECQLAMDKNAVTVNKSWAMACDSIRSRTGIEIIGNYQLISMTVEGKTWPMH